MIDIRRASCFLNRPLALLPSDAAILLETVQGRHQAQLVPTDQTEPRDRAFTVAAGIAVIPIKGVLSHSSWGWWDETSYDSVRRSMAAAIGDPDVRAIAMHINSPGGDVAGCFDLADAIYAMRTEKPIWAILDENAFSAAYALASAADRITVPRTGGTGSIGVITQHCDITGALDQMGLKITTVQFGARKSDGYPTTPLKGEALERMQAIIDDLGELFVSVVARNRDISAAKVRATEAGIFVGAEGVKAGLADAVMSPDEAFLALLETLG